MTISASVSASCRRASDTRLASPGSTVNSTAHPTSRPDVVTDFEALSPVSRFDRIASDRGALQRRRRS